MERVTAGQRPRPNYGHPQAPGRTSAPKSAPRPSDRAAKPSRVRATSLQRSQLASHDLIRATMRANPALGGLRETNSRRSEARI